MNKLKIWRNWQKLVNVTPYEVNALMDSDFKGCVAQVSKDLEEQGVLSPRQSAEVLNRMLPEGKLSFHSALKYWNGKRYKGHLLWKCASIQTNQIVRLLNTIDKNHEGIKAKLVLLKLWGHDLYKSNYPLFIIPSTVALNLYLEPIQVPSPSCLEEYNHDLPE